VYVVFLRGLKVPESGRAPVWRGLILATVAVFGGAGAGAHVPFMTCDLFQPPQVVLVAQPVFSPRGDVVFLEVFGRPMAADGSLLSPLLWIDAGPKGELALDISVARASVGLSGAFSINVGRDSLIDAEWQRSAESLCQSGARWILEITERGDMSTSGIKAAQGLRRKGARIAADDVSPRDFAALLSLRPDIIKISADDFLSESRERDVAQTVRFAHDLGADLVIEGIETPDHQEKALRLGPWGLQGYGLARPAPIGAGSGLLTVA